MDYKQYPPETAAAILAQEQHAPGVTCTLSSSYTVVYIRPDGSTVPDYAYYLAAARAGRVKHDKAGRLIVA